MFLLVSGYTRDLLNSRSVTDFSLGIPLATCLISDHYSVTTQIGFPKPALTSNHLSYRKLKDINIDFQSDLISSLELPLVSANFSDELNQIKCVNFAMLS